MAMYVLDCKPKRVCRSVVMINLDRGAPRIMNMKYVHL